MVERNIKWLSSSTCKCPLSLQTMCIRKTSPYLTVQTSPTAQQSCCGSPCDGTPVPQCQGVHPSFEPLANLMYSNDQIGSSIGSSLLSPQTRLVGVPTIGLPAAITLKIPLLTFMFASLWLHLCGRPEPAQNNHALECSSGVQTLSDSEGRPQRKEELGMLSCCPSILLYMAHLHICTSAVQLVLTPLRKHSFIMSSLVRT